MKSGWFGSLLILISIMIVGCRSGDDQPILSDPGGSGDPTSESTNQAGAGLPATGVVAQWGISAEASSEFASPEWSASQAVGSPDAPGCGDYQFAWASAASDSIEILEVAFPRAVYPLEIQIHQSFNPDQIVKVEVLNPSNGAYYTVLQKNPVPVDRPCPFVLEVSVEGIEFMTDQVRITVDQSQLGLGWNEIDAVKLVGSLNPPGQ
jgi:hypothetical protein